MALLATGVPVLECARLRQVRQLSQPLLPPTTPLTADANGQDPQLIPVPGPFLSDSLLHLFRRSSTSAKVVKRIPRASRYFAATKLAHVLDGITEHNDASSWDRLFRFSFHCLALPKRGGRRRSLASALNEQLRAEADPAPATSQSLRQLSDSRPPRDPLINLAKRVSTKLEEGDYKGAVRIACSDDTIADINDETLSALKLKHPPAHPDSCFPSPPEVASLTTVSEKEVVSAICSFPCGSAGGPDGLRPQHLKDLTSESAERGGKELVQALSSFVTHILEGRTPSFVRQVFFGANLIALCKKEGGVRPIAVGQTLRRLVAKCAGFRVVGAISATLAPQQLGYGIPLGSEAAARAARCYLENMSPGHAVVKLDFKNAFNCLRRDKMLAAVRDVAPELFQFVYSAYQTPSSLFCRDHIIQSEEGVQQGDPLGPLLFCLTIHPLVTKLTSEFKVFYLDDGTLGGSVESVLQDFQLVEREAAELGLQLNCSKSELICCDSSSMDAILSEAPGLHITSCDQAMLLGAPLGGGGEGGYLQIDQAES